MSRTVFGKLAVAAIAALFLSGCVQSQTPLITDAQPLLGKQFEVHLYEDFVPEIDDVAVERLRKAGADILGQTNAAEFGYGGFGHKPIFPTTRNPYKMLINSGATLARFPYGPMAQ